MPVRIEFYGIPRQRAGVEAVDVEAEDLGTALELLAAAVPPFARSCLERGQLKTGYIANLNGQLFTSDPRTPLANGDSLLILSTDAGG